MLPFYHISPLQILPLQPSPQAFSYSLYRYFVDFLFFLKLSQLISVDSGAKNLGRTNLQCNSKEPVFPELIIHWQRRGNVGSYARSYASI
jgi:hypothetical protein